MTPRNRLLGLLALAAALAMLVWALRPQAIRVETALVRTGPFELVLTEDGRTRVRDRYLVSAPLAGIVERQQRHAGDPVKRGETVAVLRPNAPALMDERTGRELAARADGAEAQLARLRAELKRSEIRLAQARADDNRAERLATRGFLSGSAREQALLALRDAERGLDAARAAELGAVHELAQARAALARYRAEPAAGSAVWAIRAPADGVVLRLIQESAAPVALGAPLLELGDPKTLEAVVDVLSQDSIAIRPGLAARLRIGTGAPPVEARVRRVEPAAFTKVSALGVEEQRVNVILDFSAPPPGSATLGDGYRVEAGIVLERVETALKLPVGALFRSGEDWAVFALRDGRAARQTVVVARRNGTEAQIEKGIAADEEVIVYPPESLRDGMRVVRIAKTPPAAPSAPGH